MQLVISILFQVFFLDLFLLVIEPTIILKFFGDEFMYVKFQYQINDIMFFIVITMFFDKDF